MTNIVLNVEEYIPNIRLFFKRKKKTKR